MTDAESILAALEPEDDPWNDPTETVTLDTHVVGLAASTGNLIKVCKSDHPWHPSKTVFDYAGQRKFSFDEVWGMAFKVTGVTRETLIATDQLDPHDDLLAKLYADDGNPNIPD